MPNKIFISYRRQDSAANALGISQYLEREFGRKNVFIDVDMRAGAKFPAVLEARLAECKVMLVLIGRDWLDARDEQGRRRLDNPDDWVRLEIAHALRRGIAVIPVRVNGAELPAKASLPEDIRGLPDHQTAAVTLSSFRNDMAGLTRDIRAVSPRRRGRLVAASGVALALVLTIAYSLYAWSPNFPRSFEGIAHSLSRVFGGARPDAIPISTEWTMYEVSNGRFAHLFKPASVKNFGDRVAYETRFPVDPANTFADGKKLSEGDYEENLVVVDCKVPRFALSERTVYSKSREVIYRTKWGAPEILDMSIGGTISPGAIVATAQHILCNTRIRDRILPDVEFALRSYSHFTNTVAGDGEMFHGAIFTSENSDDVRETIVIIRHNRDHKLRDDFSSMSIVGLPDSYRSIVERVEINCVDRTIKIPKIEHVDGANNLVYIHAPRMVQAMPLVEKSPLGVLFRLACKAAASSVENVQGTYEGSNTVSYFGNANSARTEEKITIVVGGSDSQVSLNFSMSNGGTGTGVGTLTGNQIEAITLQSTTPGCPGSYAASFKFGPGIVNWTYMGRDCGGSVQGHGVAKKSQP